MGRNTHHISTSTNGPSRARLRRRIAALTLLASLGAAACGADDSESSATAEPASEAPAEAASDLAIVGEAPADEAAPEAANPATGGVEQLGAPIDFGRDLVIEADITMLTSNVRDAVDDIIDRANLNGGAVFNSNVTIEDPQNDGSIPGGGQIVIKIPPQQLDPLISDLRGIGTLRNQSQSVDDVTDRLIDLDIQIRQAAESVERMEALLAETTDFNALVEAEVQLVQRQTAYERLLAVQRNLDDRVALSTLTVRVEYRSPAVLEEPIVDETEPGIADAFSDGWNAFVGLLFGLAFVLAVTAPFLAVGLVVALIAWVITRRLRSRRDADRNRHEPLVTLPAPIVDATESGDDTAGPTGELSDATQSD